MASPNLNVMALPRAKAYLKDIGRKYGEDWAKNKSAAARIAATPLTIADAVGTVMSAEKAPSQYPQTVATIGGVAFTVDPQAKITHQPTQSTTLHNPLHHNPGYAHVPGGSWAADPYKPAAFRQAGRKAAAAIDTYVIGNIPIVASLFGGLLTTTIDNKRREAARKKLDHMGAHTDSTHEAKYYSKLFSQVANDLETALTEVRNAITYFENTAKARTLNPTCDYLAHLYGFMFLARHRMAELDELVDELEAYQSALRGALEEGVFKLRDIELSLQDSVLPEVMDNHDGRESCGKHCVYDAGVVPKPLPPTPTKS